MPRVGNGTSISKKQARYAASNLSIQDALFAARQLERAMEHLDLEHPGAEMYHSRLSKAKTLMPEKVDGRTIRARRFREIYFNLVSDLGGRDNITELQRGLCKSATGILVIQEELLVLLMRDPRSVMKTLVELGKALVAVARTLGIQRQPKLINGDPLDAYLHQAPKVDS